MIRLLLSSLPPPLSPPSLFPPFFQGMYRRGHVDSGGCTGFLPRDKSRNEGIQDLVTCVCSATKLDEKCHFLLVLFEGVLHRKFHFAHHVKTFCCFPNFRRERCVFLGFSPAFRISACLGRALQLEERSGRGSPSQPFSMGADVSTHATSCPMRLQTEGLLTCGAIQA